MKSDKFRKLYDITCHHNDYWDIIRIIYSLPDDRLHRIRYGGDDGTSATDEIRLYLSECELILLKLKYSIKSTLIF